MKQFAAIAGAVLFCSALAVAAAPAGQATPRRLKVLLIMADDLNNDMGTYRHPLVRTPNLDKLAGRGVRTTSIRSAARAARRCSPV